MNPVFALVLLVLPVVIGGIITALDNARFDEGVEKIDQRIELLRSNIAGRKNVLYRFVLSPTLRVLTSIGELTGKIEQPALRSGVRVAVTLYFVTVWAILLFYVTIVLLAILLFIAVALAILWIIAKVAESDGSTTPSAPASALRTQSIWRETDQERNEREYREGQLAGSKATFLGEMFHTGPGATQHSAAYNLGFENGVKNHPKR